MQGKIVNGNFENGENGWTFKGTAAHGVDSTDVYVGGKYWIWNAGSYSGKVSQTVSGLNNGTYTVTAMVKQNNGSPTLSRLELTGYGGSSVYTPIPHSNSYSKISGIVSVTNGKINIAFYQAAAGNTNLQIDNVEILAGGETPTPTQVGLVNGGFEEGTLNGWKTTGSNAGVDTTDADSGKYKAYFWGSQGYQQKTEQDIIGLENGSYTVTARVKQNNGTPSISRMELSNYCGNMVYTNISHSSTYSQISGQVNVTNGKINIAFYQAAEANTNLQIDDVRIVKN